jgi:hypothetical protein
MSKSPALDERVSFFENEDEQSLAQDLERLARWMDTVFKVPGVGVRFGLDAILGLFPGAGDVATSLVSFYIFTAANRYGVPRVTLLRMALNIVIDLVLGAVPFVGDLFDVYWKANQRNVELLRRHVGASPKLARKLRTSDRLFVAAILIVLAALLIASISVAYLIVAWVVRAFQGTPA